MRVDMSAVGREQLFFQVVSVGQVAVVSQRNPIWRVDVQRLRFVSARCTGRRVTDVPDTHIPDKRPHVTGAEHVFCQSVVFTQKDPAALGRGDASGILAAVLQYGQRVVYARIYGFEAGDSSDSTHRPIPLG